jgi:hypothetical protein
MVGLRWRIELRVCGGWVSGAVGYVEVTKAVLLGLRMRWNEHEVRFRNRGGVVVGVHVR